MRLPGWFRLYSAQLVRHSGIGFELREQRGRSAPARGFRRKRCAGTTRALATCDLQPLWREADHGLAQLLHWSRPLRLAARRRTVLVGTCSRRSSSLVSVASSAKWPRHGTTLNPSAPVRRRRWHVTQPTAPLEPAPLARESPPPRPRAVLPAVRAWSPAKSPAVRLVSSRRSARALLVSHHPGRVRRRR
jgi:hypothetical protein